MIVGDEIGDDRQQKQYTTDRNILENDRLKSESSGGDQMDNRFIDIETHSCAETSLTNVQTRSPEMAPRLVYRNKKYGRKSCPPTLQEKYSSQPNQQFFTVNYSRGESLDLNWNFPTKPDLNRTDRKYFSLPDEVELPEDDFDDAPLALSEDCSPEEPPKGPSSPEGPLRVPEGPPCDVFTTSPLGPGSCPVSLSLDLSSRDTQWVPEYSFIDTIQSNLNTGQTSSLGSESSKVLDYTLFSALDPHNSGVAHVSSILEYLELLGIENASQVISEYGLGGEERTHLDLRHLTQIIEEEINQSQDILRYCTVRAGVCVYVNEVRVLNSFLENSTKERDKLKLDIQDSNQRLSVLLQEVDEQTEKQEQDSILKIQQLESKWQEYYHEFEKRAEEEREGNTAMIKDLSEQLNQHLINQKEEKETYCQEVIKLKKEISRLEDENSSLNSRIAEMGAKNSQILEKTEIFVNAAAGCETGTTNYSLLEKELERITQLNQELKDENDELQIVLQSERNQFERLNTRNVQIISIGGNEDSSIIDNCVSQVTVQGSTDCLSEKKNKTFKNAISDLLSPVSPVPRSTNGPSSLPSSLPSYPKKENRIGEVHHLEQHCKNLEGELDQVKFEIIRMMSEKAGYSKENETLRQYRAAFEQLQRENTSLRRELEYLRLPARFSPTSDEIQNLEAADTSHELLPFQNTAVSPLPGAAGSSTLEIPSLQEAASSITLEIPIMQRSSPDGQEFEQNCLGRETLQEKICELEKEKEEENIKFKESISGLEARVGELQESLELMRSEFESMEDYWQTKLEEEREFYEKQLRHSEEQFRELEVRVKEYEVLLLGETGKDDDRLSTIEESSSMELQASEWEQEIMQLRTQLELLEQEHSCSLEQSNLDWSSRVENLQEELEKERTMRRAAEQGRRELEERLNHQQVESTPSIVLNPEQQLSSLPELRDTKVWGREYEFTKDIPTFTPHTPTLSNQGPSSLPADLVNTAQREVRRLQDLRRIIQEECDQLLLRKERLKEEVGFSLSFNPSWEGDTFLGTPFLEAGLGNLALGDGCKEDEPVPPSPPTGARTWSWDWLDQEEKDGEDKSTVFRAWGVNKPLGAEGSARSSRSRTRTGVGTVREKMVEGLDLMKRRFGDGLSREESADGLSSHVVSGCTDACTQIPSCDELEIQTEAVAALATAYKVVYCDIEREKAKLVQELAQASSTVVQADSGLYSCLQNRLNEQTRRCEQLHTALLRQQSQTKHILESSREQHLSEVEQLESLVAAAQQLVAKQTNKYTQQLEKLSLADRVILELVEENDALVTALTDLQRKTRMPKQSQQSQISPGTSGETGTSETTKTPDNNTENPDTLEHSENSGEIESHSGKFYLEVEEI